MLGGGPESVKSGALAVPYRVGKGQKTVKMLAVKSGNAVKYRALNLSTDAPYHRVPEILRIPAIRSRFRIQ
ncbi:hypothetical protein GCM10009109_17260 [Marinobacterium sediminicola]